MNPKRWEYYQLVLDGNLAKPTEEIANDLGREGWELVGVESEAADKYAVLWFKREL